MNNNTLKMIENRSKIVIDYDKLCDLGFSGIDHSDCPDFCDAYVSIAWYNYGNGKFRELTEAELEVLNENRDFVYEKLMSHLY